MTRTILLWALALAAGAFLLQWLEYQYVARAFSREAYISVIGVAFAVGGVWVGWKLSARTPAGPFERNAAALASLGLTGQEVRVLERLAAGQSNKLEVQRRTQAIAKARDLCLIP